MRVAVDTTMEGLKANGTQFAAWAESVDEVLAHHKVDLESGLSEKQVAEKRGHFGYNELQKQAGKPMWKLILEQFDDMLVKVLLLAAVVSFALAYFEEGDESEGIRAYIEPGVILLILALNAFVGVWQESNAEAALEALKEMQPDSACVIRNGVEIAAFPARELLPGDIVEIRVGEKVPADIRIISLKTTTLRAEQASLTGESVAVSKTADSVKDANCEIQAKECMLFAGTAISNGSCTGVVNDIGMSTEIGKIQKQIQDASEEEDDSPLKKKIDDFGELLAQVIFVICILVWLINYHNFISWENKPGSSIPDWSTVKFSLASCIYYFKIAVALAVAAIPEGLPAVITTCLALGTRKMAKRNAIVRKLPSVETLGCTTMICSDKTGTLTTNQMSAVRLETFGSAISELQSFVVEGTSFNPNLGGVVGMKTLTKNCEAIAEVCSACSDARIESKNGIYKAVGAPTEAALVVLAEKLGVADDIDKLAIKNLRTGDADSHADAVARFYSSRVDNLATLEFDRNRKSMSVIVTKNGSGQIHRPVTRRSTREHVTGNSLLVKGAAECILSRCNSVMLNDGNIVSLTSNATKEIEKVIESISEQALRCLAFATKSDLGEFSDYNGDQHHAHKQLLDPGNYTSIESNLTWLGVAGLQDPPRPEVASAIKECKTAGIEMIDSARSGSIQDEMILVYIAATPEMECLPSDEGNLSIQITDDIEKKNFDSIDLGHGFSKIGILLSMLGTLLWPCVLVITGDNKLTAEAICRKIGVFNETESLEGKSMTGRAFVELSKEERRKVLETPGGKCFSRAEPRHKQDIVRVLKEMGDIVAMTGDGVNDAPALKLADIGIAMGITGTDVAKEAADMVLADDNFSTIVAAVEEGRAIYNNMKAFIRYMISSNIGEVACIFLTAALGLPENLIPVQLLWVNLVTDGPPATALGFNPPDVDIMEKPPRASDESLVTPWVFFRWMLVGCYVGFATVGAFASWYMYTSFMGIDLSADGHSTVTWQQLTHWNQCKSWPDFQANSYTAGSKTIAFSEPCDYFHEGKAKASTLSLSVLVAIEMFNALNALSEDNSLLQMPPWSNPWLLCAMAVSFGLHFVILYVPFLADVFSIVPLSFNEWMLVILFAFPVVIIDEVLKFIGRNFVNKPTSAQGPQLVRSNTRRLKEE